MFTTSTSVHSASEILAPVGMISSFRIGANEGGQQPSERMYLANWESPCAIAPNGQVIEKLLDQPSRNCHKSNPFWLTNGKRRKLQKTKDGRFSNRARPVLRTFRFSALNRAPFCARPPRKVVEYRALQRRNTQTLCGTIIFSGIVRSHGISSVV